MCAVRVLQQWMCAQCVFFSSELKLHTLLLPALFQLTYLGERMRTDARAAVLQNSGGHLCEEHNGNWLEREHPTSTRAMKIQHCGQGHGSPSCPPLKPIPGRKFFMCMSDTKMTGI